MDLPVVRSATEAERTAVIDIVTLAFSTDPLARWAIPHPPHYLAAMPRIADAFGGSGLAHGSTYVLEGYQGAALWLPPGVDPDAERLLAITSEYVQGKLREEFFGVFEQMGSYHPHEAHWYLPLIGVDPARQGRGYGAALMRHATSRCDAEGALAYLESSNPRNISLYERHGFEVLGTIQVGGSPPVTPMLRHRDRRGKPRNSIVGAPLGANGQTFGPFAPRCAPPTIALGALATPSKGAHNLRVYFAAWRRRT
jgi:GNAT superfamily N-acetyltransferase